VKISVKQLRSLITEEYLNGVPEWALREDTHKFVDQIKERIKKYILLNKSENPSDQRDAIAAMNDVGNDLEERLYDVLEDALFNFTRRV
jgi:hypothetical protein